MRRADRRQGDRPATGCFDTLSVGVPFVGEVMSHEFDHLLRVLRVVENNLGKRIPVANAKIIINARALYGKQQEPRQA